MELEFGQPWLVFAAVALFIGAGLFGAWQRRLSPVLFLLAGAAFAAAGARPGIGDKEPSVRHAIVVDVSASMRSRDVSEFVKSIEEHELPANHSFEYFELSDALRRRGDVSGQGTDYSRLGDFTEDEDINGEVLFITDGRGDFTELYAALRPERLILLPPPAPANPDARVLDLHGPTTVFAGTGMRLQATFACDADAEVPWRLLQGAHEVARGSLSLRAETPRSFSYTLAGLEGGPQRITMRLDLPSDREAGNDEATLRVIVGGVREIEYCVPADFEPAADALLQMLRADVRNRVNVRHDLPSAGELEGTAAVFINNLPLATTREQLRALSHWVTEGGSLAMVGSDGAFGPGGYRNTPIEEVMPVRFRPDNARPQRTLLLLDISQSMDDVMPGGETKLQRMKAAALRFREVLAEGDQAAVVGFREGLVGEIQFLQTDNDSLKEAIEQLQAGGSTHVHTSLGQAVAAVPRKTRILMVTDGEDVEGASEATYRALGASIAGKNLRTDVVLTTAGDKPWLQALKQGGESSVHGWSVGGEGFDGLVETLERAMAGADKEWVIDKPLRAEGAGEAIPRLVRTALRDDASINTPVLVTEPGRYPVVSWRALVGRTLAICTDSWGGDANVRLWQDSSFRDAVAAALAFILESSGELKLVLNALENGAELVWTGMSEPPLADLSTDSGTARLDVPGRWLLEDFPEGEMLRVFDGDRLLQRIPLPQRVPRELRQTGNDAAFFAEARQAGIRVLSGLEAWKPRRFGKTPDRIRDVTWFPATLAMLLLIGGFATRRR